jgi:hypothetical protein
VDNRKYLPVVPEPALRRREVHEPFDHRFRACARLLQSLWRESQGLPIGAYTRQGGERRKLGSMITEDAGDMGRNFLTPEIARLARREAAYREPRALIEERRLWTNLLSSMPLAFNLIGPLKLNLKLATRILRRICPDLADATVREVLFEHSPGRGDDTLTGDRTAFDAMLVYDRASGIRGFVAIEVTATAGLHLDPAEPTLITGPLQQFFRQHLLAHAIVQRGDYGEGRLVVIAPLLNLPVQTAITRYAATLAVPVEGQVPFETWSLESLFEQFRIGGERSYAEALRRRYCDWAAVDSAIEEAIAELSSFGSFSNDNDAEEAMAA